MFEIKVDTSSGDAFSEDATGEIGRILLQVRNELVEYGITGGIIRDSNGNRCGIWSFGE